MHIVLRWRGSFDRSAGTVLNELKTSQKLLAHCRLGDIAGTRKRLEDVADRSLSEIFERGRWQVRGWDAHELVPQAPGVNPQDLFGEIAGKHKLLEDEADEFLSQVFVREANEASDCRSDRLRRTAGCAGLYPASPSTGDGTTPITGNLRRVDQPGKFIDPRLR